MNDALWQKWNANWKWILSVAEKNDWDTSIEIKETVTEEQICELEEEINNKLPEDFRQVLKKYSSRIDFNWYMDGEIEGFEAIFCGGSDGLLWGFDQLSSMYKNYLGWIETCFPNIENTYDKVWHHKIPFLEVGNGDMLAFEIIDDKNEYPVVFLSHEGSDFNGSRLGENFIEFITNWSNVGCIGTDDWTLEIFYDKDANKLMSDSLLINEWKKAVDGVFNK